VRVLLVAETRVYWESLERALAETGRVLVTEACRPDQVSDACVVAAAGEVVLLHEQLPAGLETARRLRVAGRRVLAIGVGDSERELMLWMSRGVFGCAPHDTTLNELVTMVESVARGVPCYPSKVTGVSLFDPGGEVFVSRAAPRLTRRELEILALIDQGLSNKQIAAALTLQLATVKNHVHNLFGKLGVRRRFEAIEWLRRNRSRLADPDFRRCAAPFYLVQGVCGSCDC
jgi:two-component system, NarL family, nitrate/nitrite response regulator NarL